MSCAWRRVADGLFAPVQPIDCDSVTALSDKKTQRATRSSRVVKVICLPGLLRRAVLLAHANRAAEAALGVDDLATLAGGHALTEASGADLLDTTDFVRVMHIVSRLRVGKSNRSSHPSQAVARVMSRLSLSPSTSVLLSSDQIKSTVIQLDAHTPFAAMVAALGASASDACQHLARNSASRRVNIMDEAIPLDEVERRIDYRFSNPLLLQQAFVHASIASTRVASNERLEFLGDAVLGAVVCIHLYERFPLELEGELTKIKSSAVSRRVCADIAVDLGFADAVQLGKGMGSRTELPSSLLAALFESVVGAIYLDGGIEPARTFILRNLDERIGRSASLGHQQNFKSVLQQSLQSRELGNPSYIVLDEKGPDHAKAFEICVEVGARRFKSCWAMSKKSAEQDAALEALVELGLATRQECGEVRLVVAE